MAISIRPLTSADQAVLWEMLYYAIHIPEGETPPAREIAYQPELARYVTDWGGAGDFGFAAVNDTDQQVIGAVWLRFWTEDEHGYGYANSQTPELSIALLPAYRGFGIGSQLLSAALDLAAKSYPAVSLSVSPDNPAKRLYDRLGFEILGSDGSSLIMLKRLTPE